MCGGVYVCRRSRSRREVRGPPWRKEGNPGNSLIICRLIITASFPSFFLYTSWLNFFNITYWMTNALQSRTDSRSLLSCSPRTWWWMAIEIAFSIRLESTSFVESNHFLSDVSPQDIQVKLVFEKGLITKNVEKVERAKKVKSRQVTKWKVKPCFPILFDVESIYRVCLNRMLKFIKIKFEAMKKEKENSYQHLIKLISAFYVLRQKKSMRSKKNLTVLSDFALFWMLMNTNLKIHYSPKIFSTFETKWRTPTRLRTWF